MDVDALKVRIRSAWAGANAPTRESFSPGAPSTEAGRVAAFFVRRSWEEVDLGGLRDQYGGDGSACLRFMAPDAFRYYLAAYMFIAIDDYDAADVVGQAAVNVLTPAERPTLARSDGELIMIALPVLFYPFSRALWLAWDLYFRPAVPGDRKGLPAP